MEQISYHYPPFAGCTVIGGYSRFWMVGATLAQWCFSFTRSTLSSNLHASTAVSEVRPSLWSGMYPQTANILAPTIPESVFFIFQMTFAIITVRCSFFGGAAAPAHHSRSWLLRL